MSISLAKSNSEGIASVHQVIFSWTATDMIHFSFPPLPVYELHFLQLKLCFCLYFHFLFKHKKISMFHSSQDKEWYVYSYIIIMKARIYPSSVANIVKSWCMRWYPRHSLRANLYYIQKIFLYRSNCAVIWNLVIVNLKLNTNVNILWTV